MMKMIASVIAASTILLGAVPSWAQYRPQYVIGDNPAAICFERPEEPGSSNVEPVTVIVDGNVELTLLGGYAACAYMPVGKHSLALREQNEGGLPIHPTYRTTKTLMRFSNTKGSTRAFVICGSYTSWDIVPAGKAHPGPGGCTHD